MIQCIPFDNITRLTVCFVFRCVLYYLLFTPALFGSNQSKVIAGVDHLGWCRPFGLVWIQPIELWCGPTSQTENQPERWSWFASTRTAVRFAWDVKTTPSRSNPVLKIMAGHPLSRSHYGTLDLVWLVTPWLAAHCRTVGWKWIVAQHGAKWRQNVYWIFGQTPT